MSKQATALKRATEQSLAAMDDGLRSIYKQIQTTMLEDVKLGVNSRYKIGQLILKATKHADYGDNAVPLLAAALNAPAGDLWKLRKFAAAWTRKELDAVMKLKTPTGGSLSYSHLLDLSGLTDKKKRDALLKNAVTNGLTVKQLEEAIQVAEGRRRSDRVGGQHLIPSTVTGGLTQMTRHMESVLGREEVFQKSVFERLDGITSAMVDEKFIENLRAADARMLELDTFAQRRHRQLTVAIDQATRILAFKQNEQAAGGASNELIDEPVPQADPGAIAPPAAAPVVEADDWEKDSLPIPVRTRARMRGTSPAGHRPGNGHGQAKTPPRRRPVPARA